MKLINTTNEYYVPTNNTDENDNIDILIPTLFLSFPGFAFPSAISLFFYGHLLNI